MIRWPRYLEALGNPPSMTSQDEARRAEAAEYVAKATDNVSRSARILVLGCGDGYEIELMIQAGFSPLNIVGVNFVREEAERCATLGLNVRCTDIHELGTALADVGPFDHVMSKETLEHLMAPFVGLWEVNEVMNLDATFVHYIPEGPDKQRDWYHQNCCPDWWWLDMFRKTGFEVTSITHDIQQNCYRGRKVRAFHAEHRVPLIDLEAQIKRLRGS